MSQRQPSESLKDKRQVWLKVLRGADLHSIINQLTYLTWDAAAFRVVLEARRLAPRDSEANPQVSGLLHHLLDRSFFASQLAGIRRLCDTYPLEGPKGVHSLTGLLQDMVVHRHLMTRDAILDVEDLVYDYEPLRKAARESYAKAWRPDAPRQQSTTNPRAEFSKMRHEQIDRLAGTRPAQRTRADAVRPVVLDNLLRKINDACDLAKRHVDKFIAHASAPESRAVAMEATGITLTQVSEAHQALCEVTGFVSTCLLGDACPGFLPTPQFDQFEYLDRPLIRPDDRSTLDDLWRSMDAERHGWSQWGFDDYEAEFGSAR